MRSKFLLLAFFIIMAGNATGQFYSAGQAPGSVRWMQINTDKFQIIYPEGFYREANRVANLLNAAYAATCKGYGKAPRKISILLYNQSVQSNGFVILAPRRSEWVTTSPQDAYAMDWLQQLAVHEYRHVVQLDNLQQGLTKILKIVFGEMVVGAVAAYLPPWFLEGDAVGNETALCSTGRGRDAGFTLPLRAIEKEFPKRPTYDEAILGTYKTYLPDHYYYGYQMVTYGKIKYGNNLWESTIDNVARRPFLLVPFYQGLKRGGAGSKVKLYNDTFDSLNVLWNNNSYNLTKTDSLNYLSPICKSFTNYLFPHYVHGNIFSVKSGIDDITRFVMLDSTTETTIFTPGRYYNTPVSVGNKYIAWEEVQPDLRWQQVSYSVIKIYNYNTRQLITLKRKTRLFSPSLSPDEDSLLVDQENENYISSLLIYNIPDQKKVWQIDFPEQIHASNPIWIDKRTIAYIQSDSSGKSIHILDIKNHNEKEIFKSGFIDISNLSAKNGYIYFSYDKEQARNIYRLNISTLQAARLTHSEFGSDFANPDPQNNRLLFSDYTANGYRIAELHLKENTGTNNSIIPVYHYIWADTLSRRAGFNLQTAHIPHIQYDSSHYSRLSHALNLHSWAPFYFDPSNIINGIVNIYPGITLLSQNKLSTVTSSLSYYYYNNHNYIEPRITWAGIFPVFEFSSLFSNGPGIYNRSNNVSLPGKLHPYYQISLSSWLPFDLSRGKYYTYLRPRINYSYFNRYYYDQQYKTGYDYIEYSFLAQNTLKTSLRDIYPKFGEIAFLSFTTPRSNPDYFSNDFTALSYLYLPGIFRHHSLLFSAGYEKQDPSKYPLVSTRVPLPRGYLSGRSYRKIEYLSFEYTLPLFYPDWSLGPVIYFKRFQTSLFYDWGENNYLEIQNNKVILQSGHLSSAGFTLGAEVNFLRFFVPFEPQFTFSWLIPDKRVAIIPQITVKTIF